MFLTYQFLFILLLLKIHGIITHIVINISSNNCFAVIFLFVCLFVYLCISHLIYFSMFFMPFFLLDCSRSQRDRIYHNSSNLSLIVGRNEPFCALLIQDYMNLLFSLQTLSENKDSRYIFHFI